MNTYELDKRQDNFKTKFTEAKFELKEDNELNKKHVEFMADDTTNQTHVEEAHIVNALNNLSHTVTSDTTNHNKLTWTNANMAEQLNVALSQNKVPTDLLRKNMRCHSNAVRKPERK